MRARSIACLLLIALLGAACASSAQITAVTTAESASSEAAASSTASVPAPEMDRSEATTALVEQAFLSFKHASCVVDTIYEAVGTYDFTQPAAADVDQAAVIEGCAEGASGAAGEAPRIVVREVEVENTPEPDRAPFELTEEQMPAFAPGALAVGSVELDGTTVEYVAITPPGFAIGDAAPVFIAFPPGAQDLAVTQDVADFVYLNQAVERGWVVVTPASPGGRWWESGNASLVPEMIRWIGAWVSIEGGQPHLGGMSNGGISAFSIAAENPDAFASLMLYPGAPNSDAASELDRLTGLPIRMWVGGDDQSWVSPMQDAADTIGGLGGDVELQVIPGEGHVIQSITDGQAIFDQLDAARS